jgi:VanZ family protein
MYPYPRVSRHKNPDYSLKVGHFTFRRGSVEAYNSIIRKTMIIFLRKYWLSIITVLVILVLSLMSAEPLPPQPMQNFDKLVHITMFFGLSSVIFFDSTSRLSFPTGVKQIFYWVFIFPVVLGGLIEIMQDSFTTTRYGDWLDFLFNVIGSSFAFLITLIINRFYLMKK